MPKMTSTPHLPRQIVATMTPADLLAWRRGHGFSQRDAAFHLGISVRPYQYEETGTTRGGFRVPYISRQLELAVKGLDMELRVAKLREQEGEPEPIDAAHLASLYRAAAACQKAA